MSDQQRYGYGVPAYPTGVAQPPNQYSPRPTPIPADRVPTYSVKAFRVTLIPLDDPSYQTSDGVRIPVKGTLIIIPYSTNPTDRIQIKVGEDSDFVSYGPGAMPFLAGAPFESLMVRVPTNVAGAVMEMVTATDGINGEDDEVRVA